MAKLISKLIVCFYLLALNKFAFAQDPEIEIETDLESQILQEADKILNFTPTPYAKGGKSLETGKCEQCSQCLLEKKNTNNKLSCKKVCKSCGVDCSNFTRIVYNRAGLDYPYLSSSDMIHTSKRKLYLKFGLVDLGKRLDLARPGDILVYKGHVALLERIFPNNKGDIIHASNTRTFKRTGNGIHRRENVNLAKLRGPLIKILRHYKLAYSQFPRLDESNHEEWLRYQENQMKDKESEFCSADNYDEQMYNVFSEDLDS